MDFDLDSVRNLTNRGEFDRAEAIINRLLNTCNSKEDVRKSEVLSEYARLLEAKGEALRAIEVARTAVKIAESVEISKELGIAEHSLGSILWRQGELNECFKHLNRAKEIREQVGDIKGLGQTLNNLGVYYWRRMRDGDWEQALEVFVKSIELGSSIGDIPDTAAPLQNIGILYAHRGDLRKALDYYEQSLKAEHAAQNLTGIASSLAVIATVHWALGETKTAKNTLEQSFELYSQPLSKDDGYWVAMKLFIEMAAEEGKYQEAMDKVIVLEEIIAQTHSSYYQSMIFLIHGLLELVQRNLGNAKQQLTRSLEIAKAEKYTQILLEAQLKMAEVILRQYELSTNEKLLYEVASLLEEIEKHAQELKSWPTIVDMLLLRAMLNIASLDHENAIKLCEDAIKLAQEKELLKSLHLGEHTLARIIKTRDRFLRRATKEDEDQDLTKILDYLKQVSRTILARQ